MAVTDMRHRHAGGRFVAWLVVGAGYALGLLSILSIGLPILAGSVVATILIARRRHAIDGIFGLVSGLALPLLYVAFLNRAGPGTICTTTASGQTCSDESSPWPWIAAGAVLLVIGLVGFVVWPTPRDPPTGR